MTKTPILWAVVPTLAIGVLSSTVGIVVGSADPLPFGPDTCINGFVWRNARAGDAVCVTPATRDQVAQENADPGAHKDPNGASGPQSCAQGFVWRQAFDGDTICVTPDIRSAALADNAAAASRKAANQPAPPPEAGPGAPKGPAPTDKTVTLQATGGGTATTIDLDDPQTVPRQYDVALPYAHTRAGAPQSGQLYQIVAVGKGSAHPGCSISVGGQVMVSQPQGGSGQCFWVAP